MPAGGAAARAELGLTDNYYDTSAGQRERMLKTTEKLDKTTDRIQQGRSQLAETEVLSMPTSSAGKTALPSFTNACTLICYKVKWLPGHAVFSLLWYKPQALPKRHEHLGASHGVLTVLPLVRPMTQPGWKLWCQHMLFVHWQCCLLLVPSSLAGSGSRYTSRTPSTARKDDSCTEHRSNSQHQH